MLSKPNVVLQSLVVVPYWFILVSLVSLPLIISVNANGGGYTPDIGGFISAILKHITSQTTSFTQATAILCFWP